MNKRRVRCVPPVLDRLPMDPALPGWAHFGAGPLGLDCKYRFPMFIPPLTCHRQVSCCHGTPPGMPHGMPGQAGQVGQAGRRGRRNDKGKGSGFIQSGYWTEAFFVRLGGPQGRPEGRPLHS